MRLLPNRLILPPLPKPSPDKSTRRHTFSAGRWRTGCPVSDRAISRQNQPLCLTASFARLTADTDYPEGLAQPALGKMVGAFQQDYAKHIKQFLQLQLLHTPHSGEILNRVLPDLRAAARLPPYRPRLKRSTMPTRVRCCRLFKHAVTAGVWTERRHYAAARMGEYLHRHLSNSELVPYRQKPHIAPL